MTSFDVVHLAAGAVWLGGLVGLVSSPSARSPSGSADRIVRRFSQAAVVAVVVVTAMPAR